MAGGHEVSLPGRTLMHVGAMYRDIHTNFFNCEPLLSSPEAWSCKNKNCRKHSKLPIHLPLLGSRSLFLQSINQTINYFKQGMLHLQSGFTCRSWQTRASDKIVNK